MSDHSEWPGTGDENYSPVVKAYVDATENFLQDEIDAETARAIAAEAGIVAGTGALVAANNLSDVPNKPTARTNLGLGTAATSATSAFDAAGAATTAQGLSLQKAQNLADLQSAGAARANLALGTAAVADTTDFDAAGAAASKAPIASPTFTGTVTLAADATTGLQAVTYQQLIAVASAGGTPKAVVACATTGNITLSGEQTLDGVLTSASRVLVDQQTTGSQNGIYVSAAGAWTRATDCDQAAEFINGSLIPVAAGTTFGGKVFLMLAPSPFTVGTTTSTYSLVGATYTAGTGITLTGTAFSINTAVVPVKTDNLSVFAATTSAQLRGVLSDETGTGAAVFATSPAITTPTGIVKGDVGLGNVDNTSNATERAASATLTNKTLTSPVINTPTGIVKGDVGLGNVDNTSDVNKPVSTAQAAANALLTPQTRTLTAGTGLTGGGDLSADRTVALDSTTQATLASIAAQAKALAGWTIPTNSLDRWKAGRSRPGTQLVGALDASTTFFVPRDPQITPTTLHRFMVVGDGTSAEGMFTTAGESVATAITGITSVATTGIFTKTTHGLLANQPVIPAANVLDSFLTSGTAVYVSATNLAANTFSVSASPGGSILTGTTNDTNLTMNVWRLTVTTRGSVNGSAAVTHVDKSNVYVPKWKTIVHLGDSIAEGTDNQQPFQAADGWSLRAARMQADRMGGLIGQSWPLWRSTSLNQAHQEYVLNGTAAATTNLAYDCGYHGALIWTSGTGNGYTWTRPAGVRCVAVDIQWVDKDATSAAWSYSLDGGTTWIDNPVASIFSSGKGLLRRTRVACDDPTDIRVRAANAAGTGKAIVTPYVPLTTWAVFPHAAIAEGVHWANLGQAGVKLRTILNARVVHDAVTDGSGGLTSATAAFVANDVSSYVFLDGVQTTISARTNGTTATTAASVAAGSGKRLTILQGSGTGDWIANFLGHHASWFPDLVLIGPFDNDIINGGTLGDGDYDFYGDMFQWLITQIKPVANIIVVAPHENGSQPAPIQASYRSVLHTVAATNSVAILDLYDAFSVYGFTGYTAVHAVYMVDTIHFNALGNEWMGAHLNRGLEIG